MFRAFSATPSPALVLSHPARHARPLVSSRHSILRPLRDPSLASTAVPPFSQVPSSLVLSRPYLTSELQSLTEHCPSCTGILARFARAQDGVGDFFFSSRGCSFRACLSAVPQHLQKCTNLPLELALALPLLRTPHTSTSPSIPQHRVQGDKKDGNRVNIRSSDRRAHKPVGLPAAVFAQSPPTFFNPIRRPLCLRLAGYL